MEEANHPIGDVSFALLSVLGDNNTCVDDIGISQKSKHPYCSIFHPRIPETRGFTMNDAVRQLGPFLAQNQLRVLETETAQPQFGTVIASHGQVALVANDIQVLQINVGKLCNQTCRHCHVDAGPNRREMMSREVMEACVEAVRSANIPTVDITGGAPELNPHFRWLVSEIRALGRHVIDRCNLTVLVLPGQADLPEFLAENQVEVIASLPCYLESNVDQQRGSGVFERSIEALHRLNDVGYGLASSQLLLNLVYNPLGPSLPPPQAQLEEAYHRELKSRYGVTFNRLYTLTNLPISRFLSDLMEQGQLQAYMQTLVESFNPATLDGLMCRTTLSVDWQGYLYDCDFNQMLEMRLPRERPQRIQDFDLAKLSGRPIVTGRHCFGCTAGAGSTCQGAISRDT